MLLCKFEFDRYFVVRKIKPLERKTRVCAVEMLRVSTYVSACVILRVVYANTLEWWKDDMRPRINFYGSHPIHNESVSNRPSYCQISKCVRLARHLLSF